VAPSLFWGVRLLALNALAADVGKYADLLPRLGAMRPERSQLDSATRNGLWTAIKADVQWFPAMAPETCPALWQRCDQAWAEKDFVQQTAFPLFSLAAATGWTAGHELRGLLWGAAVGLIGWLLLQGATAALGIRALSAMLDAVYIGKIEALR
jgi:hypothetical protein